MDTKVEPLVDLSVPTLTTTVFVAAPLIKDHVLGITGADEHLDHWKSATGTFQVVNVIDEGYGIYRGTIPIPTKVGCDFKFGFYDENDEKKKIDIWEGESRSDNRKTELLPDVWEFFVFKDFSKSKGKFRDMFKDAIKFFLGIEQKPEVRGQIVTFFARIILNRIYDEKMNWDDALDFLETSLMKINDIKLGKREELAKGYADVIEDFFGRPEENGNTDEPQRYDDVFFPLVCASLAKVESNRLKNFLRENAKPFSLYLHQLLVEKRFKRTERKIKAVFADLITYAGRKYSWLMFRLNLQERKLLKDNVFESLIETLQTIPDVVLVDDGLAGRVLEYLLQRSSSLDELHSKLIVLKEKKADEFTRVEMILLNRAVISANNVDKKKKILQSNFICNQVDQPNESTSQERLDSTNYFKFLFSGTSLSNFLDLVSASPDVLVPAVEPIVNELFQREFNRPNCILSLSSEERKFWSNRLYQTKDLDRFPTVKGKIRDFLLQFAIDKVERGMVHEIPTIQLMLLALNDVRSQRKISFCQRPSLTDLQQCLTTYLLFQNLISVIGKDAEKSLKPYRNGPLKELVDTICHHSDQVAEIVDTVKAGEIKLVEIDILFKPLVVNLLKKVEPTLDISHIRVKLATLKKRHQLHADLFQKVSRLEDTEVLSGEEWNEYLNNVGPDSEITLQEALNLNQPISERTAAWLSEVIESELFMRKIWHPLIQAWQQEYDFPLETDDFSILVEQNAARRWKQLAEKTAEGLLTFQEMEANLELLSSPRILDQCHLEGPLLVKGKLSVQEAYREFRILQEIRHLINPFVAALRQFTIVKMEPVEQMYAHVSTKLLANWNGTTLTETRRSGLGKTLQEQLKIDPERPETKETMIFISSLVTDENRSPLIEWLRNKTDQDMEAMGRILQGNLRVVYGQLQTLKTRVAPFLTQRFETYEHLLRTVTESEKLFAEKAGRVQNVDTKYLANMLPEIEATVRAAVISPYENAKEKLKELVGLKIRTEDDKCVCDVVLERSGTLTVEELQNMFQLFEMSALDDHSTADNEKWVTETRETVVRLFRLVDLFQELSRLGCTAYAVSNVDISLDELDGEIEERNRQIGDWKNLWVEMKKLPHLALFSRQYLLHFADLIRLARPRDATALLRMYLSFPFDVERRVTALIRRFGPKRQDGGWLSTEQLFQILLELNGMVQSVFQGKKIEEKIPPFLEVYGRSLCSHFMDKAVHIFNVSRELVVGSALAAYLAVTRNSVDPRRILFLTANTDPEEIERFMTLWAVSTPQDFFVMIHIERLSTSAAAVIRDVIIRVVPECRARLLLLAQQHCQIQATRSLGARLGVPADRMLEVNFNCEQLRECLTRLLPRAANVSFFTSKYPGCGKSQRILQMATRPNRGQKPAYYRIPVRTGTVEELLTRLRDVEKFSVSESATRPILLHFDVAHSSSLEFNDIILSLLINGALFDHKKPRLGSWNISERVKIAVELSSPFGAREFPIIDYLGVHNECSCNVESFSYDLASMPRDVDGQASLERSVALVAAAKFLQIQRNKSVPLWDQLCLQPETLILDPLPETEAFNLLVQSFQHSENQEIPTFATINSMAKFLYRHVRAMVCCTWLNASSVYLFESPGLAQMFKLNVFDLLLKVANDTVSRSWTVRPGTGNQRHVDMDWTHRQRALLLLGIDDYGNVLGMNIVGRDKTSLMSMFHPSLIPILQTQGLNFLELKGFNNLLLDSKEGANVVINAMRSLLLLDGTEVSRNKVIHLDRHDRSLKAADRLQSLIGKEGLGYALTGDNLTKMMFGLYRIRCGLPVVVLGEAGVGKSALFRFLISTLLGHEFHVCNVNSGTSVADVDSMVAKALETIAVRPEAQVFLFFDEMNTADPCVIAFLKELMLDRHYNGVLLPENIYMLAAANPDRLMQESNREAAVGLAFRFAGRNAETQKLVYRVNPLPLSFYDHLYDFGHLCDEAEDSYIDEICYNMLNEFPPRITDQFVKIVCKSHKVSRAFSSDSPSAVSLRDATRAVHLFRWFQTNPAGKQMADDDKTAAQLSIYLVYAFRFTKRKHFLENVFHDPHGAVRAVKKASRNIAEKLYREAHGASIGSGVIALNEALCENLFALYVCVLNGIFVIIVGRPGSSKSLSVEILKLVLSPGKHKLRQSLGGVPAVTELYFQCSPLSTSSGFRALFESARQLSNDPKLMLAMVVLDELGLADLSPEKPIKVLHSELERRAVLTSGETEQCPYSVVALSNWVVDAAQVNRGILIQRSKADSKDLLTSAEQMAESLVKDFVVDLGQVSDVVEKLRSNLKCITDTYQKLDDQVEIGGGHFFSMRDFFFCVKKFVCSVFPPSEKKLKVGASSLRISNDQVIRSVIRNFGGHDAAQVAVREIISDSLELEVNTLPRFSPLDLIVENIQDSSQRHSIHIARHLMILNRSMIGLQLLDRHVRSRIGDSVAWHVLFGSCFPGDLKILAVTRKLRQVEQAIRSGGVLVLCHANQLFESLYMVLNQQYWAQGEVKMTQIALGPSTRSIALPNGPFRIIALQDTDVALNRDVMSPAVLSRFEKHELRPFHLLNEFGTMCLSRIESHPVWIHYGECVKKRNLLYGYHEELFASLALSVQDLEDQLLEQDPNQLGLDKMWMRAVQPMEMIKLELTCQPELVEMCQYYRYNYVYENIDDALEFLESNRLVIMTNTLRHLEIVLHSRSIAVVRLFDIQTELELFGQLESVPAEAQNDPEFCLFIQYDATVGPIEQFQFTKYEIENRWRAAKCRVIFIVHVDPGHSNRMNWVFSFGDGWNYCFVDEILPRSLQDGHRVPLRVLVDPKSEWTMAEFIDYMTADAFKALVLEMLGPILQKSLTHLRSGLGHFYSDVRTALNLPGNVDLIDILRECLMAQLKFAGAEWNLIEAINDRNFDSSASLTEALWGVIKHKLGNPLAHLLLVSDVSKVRDEPTLTLWCNFIEDNYPDRLLCSNSGPITEIPVGFRVSSQPFGRLLNVLKKDCNQNLVSSEGPTHWLVNYIRDSESDDETGLKPAYFCDWMRLRMPSHLHRVISLLPVHLMGSIVDEMFQEPNSYVADWEKHEANVVAALELFSIATFTTEAKGEIQWKTRAVRNWKQLVQHVTETSLKQLANWNLMESRQTFFQAITSIEMNRTLSHLVSGTEYLADQWLKLRITKRMLLFDKNCKVSLPARIVTGNELIKALANIIIDSVIRPRLITDEGRTDINQSDLYSLLNAVGLCSSSEALLSLVRQCPVTRSLVPVDESVQDCPRCGQPLISLEGENSVAHLVEPDRKSVELLFQDNQKFLFFFERVAELFIEHQRSSPKSISSFLAKLVKEKRLPVSWRFMTVIVRSILAVPGNEAILDLVLSSIPCNHPNELKFNEENLLRALVMCAEHDVPVDSANLEDAVMEGEWTMERIRRLAQIRLMLLEPGDELALDAVRRWRDWRNNQRGQEITDGFLFFILRFITHEGERTELSRLLTDPRFANHLLTHPVVEAYKKTMSPLSLGIAFHPPGLAEQFNEMLLSERPIQNDQYRQLRTLDRNWAPFIGRLAFHLLDVAGVKMASLGHIIRNPAVAAQLFLPGVDIHPELESFNREAFRWYICACGVANYVGNCGHVVADSYCMKCRKSIGTAYTALAPGVRRATLEDFQPPRGFHLDRQPPQAPSYSVRGQSPLVTRFSQLLVSTALMAGVLNGRIQPNTLQQLLNTLPWVDRRDNENRSSLIQILHDYVMFSMQMFAELYGLDNQLTVSDKFKAVHLLLNRLTRYNDARLNAAFTGIEGRVEFEAAIGRFLRKNGNLQAELEQLDEQMDENVKLFKNSLYNNEIWWTYKRRVSADRHSVRLEFARNGQLKEKFPFINVLLDDTWAAKLDALERLGNAMRFVALVRTILQGKLTQEEATRMTIRDGLDRLVDAVSQKTILLDRGQPVGSYEDVERLWNGLKELWNLFSSIPNADNKTFLEYFECQQVTIGVRPGTTLKESDPLILILAGGDVPEAMFVGQLLSHAVEAAASVSLMAFVQPHCRSKTGRVRLSCLSSMTMAEFDESLFSHVSREDVDVFLRDHAIERNTLELAESFAMTAILGPAGSTIAQDLFLEPFGEFVFQDAADSLNFLATLEKRSLVWQPVKIPLELEERIISDLEKSRLLGQAKDVLVSAIQFVQENTEPLLISKVRSQYLTDVVANLIKDEILTDLHVSNETLAILNIHLKLEVCHLFPLIRAVYIRMKGDDIFGGRVPEGWTTMLSEADSQATRHQLQSLEESIVNTLRSLARNVSAAEPSTYLMPDKSLLSAIRQIEGEDWNGLSAELKMEHLGHVLLIAESVAH